jgi:hypothetical protein
MEDHEYHFCGQFICGPGLGMQAASESSLNQLAIVKSILILIADMPTVPGNGGD